MHSRGKNMSAFVFLLLRAPSWFEVLWAKGHYELEAVAITTNQFNLDYLGQPYWILSKLPEAEMYGRP